MNKMTDFSGKDIAKIWCHFWRTTMEKHFQNILACRLVVAVIDILVCLFVGICINFIDYNQSIYQYGKHPAVHLAIKWNFKWTKEKGTKKKQKQEKYNTNQTETKATVLCNRSGRAKHFFFFGVPFRNHDDHFSITRLI